jgi:hypothetical protein
MNLFRARVAPRGKTVAARRPHERRTK